MVRWLGEVTLQAMAFLRNRENAIQNKRETSPQARSTLVLLSICVHTGTEISVNF